MEGSSEARLHNESTTAPVLLRWWAYSWRSPHPFWRLKLLGLLNYVTFSYFRLPVSLARNSHRLLTLCALRCINCQFFFFSAEKGATLLPYLKLWDADTYVDFMMQVVTLKVEHQIILQNGRSIKTIVGMMLINTNWMKVKTITNYFPVQLAKRDNFSLLN